MIKPFSTLPKSLIEAFAIAAVTAVIALGINLVHPNKIPFVASEEYETMVPCPVQEGHVTPLEAQTLSDSQYTHTLFIDARDKTEFERWHYSGAMSLTYDFLDPIPERELNKMAKRIAAKRATRVVVYGDGAAPDTGRLLGIDISASGINNVFYIRGGATALKEAGAHEKERHQ